MFVCLLVCLYPINVKTAEPFGLVCNITINMTPGNVYGRSTSQNLASQQNLIFHIIFIKSGTGSCFLFYKAYKEKMFTIEIEDGREAPLNASFL